MKANSGKGNNVSRDEWETPKWLFDILHKQYKFTADCCANSENAKVYHYSDDFLSIKESDIISWMNPPFSIAWKMIEHFFKVIKRGVAIYRADNFETGIWQNVIFPNADWIFIPNRRINYEGLSGEGSRFPSALIGIGVEPPKELSGVTLFVHKLA